MSVVVVLEAAAAYNRNQLWGDAVAMWQDSVSKSPGKERPEFQLASLYYSQGRCAEAADTFAKARMPRPDDSLLLDWGLALQCAGRGDEAIAKLQQAVAIRPGVHAYTQLAMVYAKQGRYPEALQALDAASRINPSYALIYYYRGTIWFKQGDTAKAVDEYRRGLALSPNNALIRGALAQAEAAAGTR
jgi:tetratricopeptide (TPR) repeat protein